MKKRTDEFQKVKLSLCIYFENILEVGYCGSISCYNLAKAHFLQRNRNLFSSTIFLFSPCLALYQTTIFLPMSNLKAFADNNFNVAQMVQFF